jgi:ribosomal protein S18 acetylase RimI-like enzyme
MIDIRPLTGVSFETMAEAFNDAFSDYDIPAKYSVEYLTYLVQRRGYRPDLAVGAFDGERLVGFVFNCLQGEDAYNSGTGVVISHRRHGIARQLMQRSIETLPAKRYTLEVIETNHRAIALYRSLRFDEPRRFQCWTYATTRDVRVKELANADLEAIAANGDIVPAWQNSLDSIRRAREPHVVLGDERGAVVFFPQTGDVPLLAVRRDARRHGLGTQLLDAAATRSAKPLRIMNIDVRAEDIGAFMAAIGAKPLVRQIEMIIDLPRGAAAAD